MAKRKNLDVHTARMSRTDTVEEHRTWRGVAKREKATDIFARKLLACKDCFVWNDSMYCYLAVDKHVLLKSINNTPRKYHVCDLLCMWIDDA